MSSTTDSCHGSGRVVAFRFETGTSCGLNKREVRERWERDLFQGGLDRKVIFDVQKKKRRAFFSASVVFVVI